MRGRDDETGEFFSPSRSANRRAALDVLELGEQLVALSPAQLARLPIPDELLPHIRETQRIASDAARRETAAMHRIEALRDALLGEDGDAAMTELLDEHPDADRQKLRQLVRNAHEERKRNKPPRAYRELFRELRGLQAQDGDASNDDADDAFDDEGDEDHG